MSLQSINRDISKLQISKTKYVAFYTSEGSLTPQTVAQYILNNKNIHKNLKPFEKKNIFERETDNNNYWICIRNHQTGTEDMTVSPISLDDSHFERSLTLKNWFLNFSTSSVFKDINLYNIYSPPELSFPSENELWKQTSFYIQGITFTVTVFRDSSISPEKSITTTQRDHVIFQ